MKKTFIYFTVGFVLSHLFLSCESKEDTDIPHEASSIILSVERLDIYEGDILKINAYYNTGELCSPSWHSDNISIASVDSLGGIMAHKEGSCKIWASINNTTDVLISNKCAITVLKDSIILSENNKLLYVGESFHLSASLKSQKNKSFNFSSDDVQIASVDNNGHVVANSIGNTSINVTYDTLKASCLVQVRETSGTENGHEWVDLGLSVRWATMNVGATSETDYGKWYCWGEINPKTYVSWSTYKWYDNNYTINWGDFYFYAINKYTIDDGWNKARWYEPQTTTTEVDGVTTYKTTYVFIGDGKTTLDPEDDVATTKWGSKWRMPSKSECQEIIDKCRWVYGSVNGVMGTKIIGPNEQSIFIPAAGHTTPDGQYMVDKAAAFWTNELANSTGYAFCMSCGNSKCECDAWSRVWGLSIRPVCPYE